MRLPQICASASGEPVPRVTLSSLASARSCSPKVAAYPAGESLACASRRSNCAISRFMIATPPGTRPEKISALASAISSRLEEFEVHRRDGGNDRHVRAHHLRKRRDLASMIHADFIDAKARLLRHACKRERHAPMIIVGGSRGMRGPRSAEHEPQSFFGRRLADRARHRNNARGRAAACRSAKPLERRQDVVDDIKGTERTERIGMSLIDNSCGRSFFKGRADIVVAIGIGSADCKEQIAFPERPAVDRNSLHPARRHNSAHARAERVYEAEACPKRAFCRIHHEERSFNTARTQSLSENGNVVSPMIWPDSWPLPAMTRPSRGPSMAMARAIASARPATSPALRRSLTPARIALRIKPGSSERGLSSVMMT